MPARRGHKGAATLTGRLCHAELRGLAAESLQLLRAALFDARFPALFELPVFGSIVGMFELNNLGETPPTG